MRGRTLDPHAVEEARKWQEDHIKHLKKEVLANPMNFKARRELRWKWGIKLEGLDIEVQLNQSSQVPDKPNYIERR